MDHLCSLTLHPGGQACHPLRGTAEDIQLGQSLGFMCHGKSVKGRLLEKHRRLMPLTRTADWVFAALLSLAGRLHAFHVS